MFNQSWADANQRFRVFAAKAFCRRDGRRRDSDEKDANTKDAMCHVRKILHILKCTTLANKIKNLPTLLTEVSPQN